jgi:hypothetical protein
LKRDADIDKLKTAISDLKKQQANREANIKDMAKQRHAELDMNYRLLAMKNQELAIKDRRIAVLERLVAGVDLAMDNAVEALGLIDREAGKEKRKREE